MHEFFPKNLLSKAAGLPGARKTNFFAASQEVIQRTSPAAPATQAAAFTPCDPPGPLTWTNYQGSVASGNSWGAETMSGIKVVTFNGNNRFQAVFDSTQSWALPKYKTPSDNAVNGCQVTIIAMENFIRAHPGQSATYQRPTQLNCAATILPNQVTARNITECTTVFGAECKRAMGLESQRLLKHEKLHYAIACKLAKNANNLIDNGRDFAAVHTGLLALYNKLNIDNGSGQGDYDVDTRHGCDQAKQNDWQTKVANGLTGYNIIS